MRKIVKFKGILFISVILFNILSCQSQEKKANSTEIESYSARFERLKKESISKGSVSNGTLINGVLFPFSGVNFQYFDTTSYVSGRAFLNSRIENSTIETYQEFEKLAPNRFFYIMECSNQHGGKMHPHRTHQNGLSVDFMMPLIKNNLPFYELDVLGKDHYLLTFDNDGRYSEDKSISVDFDLIAHHILVLNEKEKKHGYKISKVIIKIEFKDKLFNSKYGKELKESGIYIVKGLSPLINSLHDEHYHVDFVKL